MDEVERLNATRSLAPPAAAGGEFRSYLLVVTGTTSAIVPLPRNGSVLVGRGPEADIRIASDAASRRHARVTVVEGEIEVADLDSHNGTRLNGAPLRGASPLRSGDALAIGDVVMVLHVDPARAALGLVDAALLRARLGGEVARALGFERSLAVVAVAIPKPPRDRRELQAALGAVLRPFDVAGWADANHLIVVAPELDAERGEALAEAVMEALAGLGLAPRAGVADCPTDGCQADALLAAARAAATAAAIGECARATGAAHALTVGGRPVVIADPAMVRLYELVRRLAASTLSVVVTGETGAGKDHVAHAVHDFSPRRGGPFVTLNCAALPEGLLESELFGHERGAFTGAVAAKPGLLEVARGGTVFLDEVGELPAAAQAKLLRAVETRRVTRVGGVAEHDVDFRLVAATHRDLDAEVAAGRFRQDLLFRLGQAVVALPPLRDRPRELALLARRFLDTACEAGGRAPMHVSTSALHKLARYAWPGNVRELKNVMEVAAATVAEDTLEPWHLPDRITGARGAPPPRAVAAAEPASGELPPPTFVPLADELRDLERRRMGEALVATRGNRTRAAELLQMPLRTFLLRIKQYDLVDVGRPG